MLTLKEKLRFYKNKDKVRPIILDNARRKGHIVHGATAWNVFFPPYLDRHTEDVDVFSKTPRKTARRVERRLDREFGGDYFKTVKGQHKGTYKVVSNVTSRTAADYTKPDGKVPSVTRRGVKYAKLSHAKKKVRESLANPDAAFRHKKDRELRQRIKIAESLPKKRKKREQGLIRVARFLRRL